MIGLSIDITERKRIEQQIAESERKYRQIVETAQEGIWMLDENLRTTFVNGKMCELLEYSAEEMIGRTSYSFRRNFDVAQSLERRDLNKQGINETHESVFNSKSGKEIYTKISTNPIFDNEGTFIGSLAMVADITDLKKAEAGREFERRNKEALINSTQDLIWSVSRDYNLITANKAFLMGLKEFTGFDLKAGDCLLITDIYPADYLDIWQKLYEKALAGNSFIEVIEINKGKMGGRLWAEVFFSPIIMDNNVEGVACFSRDITEKKATEEKLRKSEEKYRQIVETAQEGIWMMDENFRTTFTNEKLCDLLGYTEDEMIGRTNYSFRKEDDMQGILARRELRKLGNAETHESEFISKSGKIIHTKVSTNPLFSDDGTYIGSLAMITDISDLKKAEEEKELERRNKESLINSTQDLIWSVSSDYKLIAANKAFFKEMSKSLGVQLEEGHDLMLAQLIPSNFLQNWKGFYQRALSGNTFTEEILTPASLHYTNTWSQIIFDPIYQNDRVIGVACFSRNITEKKIAEEKLKESEAHLAEAQRLSGMGSWNFDFRTDKLTWSEELYNVLGTDKKTFIDTHGSFIDLVIEEDRERVRQTSSHTQKTGDPFLIEYNIITTAGEKRTIQEHGFGEKDSEGKIIRLFGTAQDITERKRIEKQMVESETRYRKAQTQGRLGHWELNLENNDLLWSDEIYKIFGLEEKVATLDYNAFFNFIHPDDREMVQREMDSALAGLTNYNIYHRIVLEDGSIRYVHEVAELIMDEIGKPVKFAGMVQDVTEQKLLEEDLTYFRNKLQITFRAKPSPTLDGWVGNIQIFRGK